MLNRHSICICDIPPFRPYKFLEFHVQIPYDFINIFTLEDHILRVWVKLWKDNRMLRDTVVEDTGRDTRTHKIFNALEEACRHFDLGQPIWLEKNIAEFKRHAKTRFYQDSFIESIEFDYMEFQILDEDRS